MGAIRAKILCVAALAVAVSFEAVSSRTVSGDGPFQVAHGWPILPEGEVLGSSAGVGVDSGGNVLVFHRAGRVWTEPLPLDPINKPTVNIFDGNSGKVIARWGAGMFAMPHGLTVDDHDNVWLTDVALQQVFKFTHEGKLLMVVGERGVSGNDRTHFNRPTDVAVLRDGSFYVSDGYRNTRVVKFSPEGKFLFQWGTPGNGNGEFNTPHAITLDKTGRVYVADRGNDRVQVFDAKGTFVTQWKSKAMGRPYSLVLIGGGLAAVVDGGEQPENGPDRSGVSLVDMSGKVIERFGRFGNYDGQFRMGHDIAVDRSGNLYVVDITGQRIQKFARHR